MEPMMKPAVAGLPDDLFIDREDIVTEEEKKMVPASQIDPSTDESAESVVLTEHEQKIIQRVLNIRKDKSTVPVAEVTMHGEKMVKVPIQTIKIRVPFHEPKAEVQNCAEYWKKYTNSPKVYTAAGNVPSHPDLAEANVPHGLLAALLYAYNYHADIVLTPDDVWITIMYELSRYIKENAEGLREKFVSHQGKEEIAISASGSIADADWGDVLKQFRRGLTERVKDDFAKKCVCDFSTTKEVELNVSIASLMCSMGEYFNFVCYGCGIRNVYFTGTLADWLRLRTKVANLKHYVEDKTWIDSLLFIVEQFAETYRGRVNLDFWNKMVDKVNGVNPSTGGVSTTLDMFTGWILNLMHSCSTKIWLRNFPETTFQVPVKYVEASGNKLDLTFVAGFSGLRYKQEAFRPQMSYAIVEGEAQRERPDWA